MIYIFEANSEYDAVLLEKKTESLDFHDRLNGRRQARRWRPVAVRLTPRVRHDGDVFELYCDAPVVGERARQVLLAVAHESVEFLPLKCGKRKLWALNVCAVIDALDEANSIINSRTRDGQIVSIRRYAFVREEIGKKNIFKLRGLEFGYIFVSETFKEVVEAAGLKGAVFLPAEFQKSVEP